MATITKIGGIACDIPVINLDMEKVVHTAILERTWLLEFNDAGTEFTWVGKATSRTAAEHKARAELSEKLAEFNRYKARLVKCLEAS